MSSESAFTNLYMECNCNVPLYLAKALSVIENSFGITGSIEKLAENKVSVEWFDPDRHISEEEHQEFLADQEEVQEEEPEPVYMNYDPDYLFTNSSIQRQSLDSLPYRDHIYASSPYDYDTMRGRPRSAISLPSRARPHSASSARSGKSTMSEYENLAAKSSREAQILFVEDINKPKGQVPMKVEYMKRLPDQNIQVISAPYRKKSPVLQTGFVRGSQQSFVKGGGFRVKKVADNSYTRDYRYYRQYGFAGHGAKTSYGHNYPSGTEPPIPIYRKDW